MVWPNEHRFSRPRVFGAMCVTVAVLLVVLAFSAEASAGVIVNCDAMLSSEMAVSESPATPCPPMPLTRDNQRVLLHAGVTTGTGGAGSPSTNHGSGTVSAALTSLTTASVELAFSSRLRLCWRAFLPSALEDRFFRPPRV